MSTPRRTPNIDTVQTRARSCLQVHGRRILGVLAVFKLLTATWLLATMGGCDALAVDVSPPRLLRAPFAPGLQAQVSSRPKLEFSFSEAIDPETVHPGSVVLLPYKGHEPDQDAEANRCGGPDACSPGLCLRGRCAEDPLTSTIEGALRRGEAELEEATTLELSLGAGPGGPNSVLMVQPARALAPHRAYAVFVGGLRDLGGNPVGLERVAEGHAGEAEILRADFVTGRRDSAGPEPELVWPAPGSRLVPTNLAYVETAFVQGVFVPEDADADTEAGPELVLEPEHERTNTVRLVDPLPCEGWVPGTCLRWRVAEPLLAATRYRLAVVEGPAALVDERGRPAIAPHDSFWFESGPGPDTQAPRAQVWAFERSTCTHVVIDVQERVRASWVGPRTESTREGRGRLELAMPQLVGDAESSMTLLQLEDAAGMQSAIEVELGALDPSDEVDLVVTEVLVNAEGSESAGEFVEVVRRPSPHRGARGYQDLYLADLPWAQVEAELLENDPPGDALGYFELEPGQVAVLAGESFDPSKLPPDAVFIPVGASLGSGGIKNSGEPLTLYDAVRRRPWSSYSALEIDHAASEHEGQSAVRRSLDACDIEDAWRSDPSGSASPGRW